MEFVTSQGLLQGTGTSTFAPGQPMTRAMLVTALWRLEGEPAAAGTSGFPDVKPDAWYTEAVDWASQTDIVSGTGAGFDPEGSVTREQIASILYRYCEAQGLGCKQNGQSAGFLPTVRIPPLGQPGLWSGPMRRS